METKPKKTWWKTPFGMLCTAIFLMTIFVLIQDNSKHIGNYWIWLILLGCPLMHIFMHGNHHTQTNNEQEKDNEVQERP